MTNYTVKYLSPSERLEAIATAESLGHRMVSDSFYEFDNELVFEEFPVTDPLPMLQDGMGRLWKAATIEEKLDLLGIKAGFLDEEEKD